MRCCGASIVLETPLAIVSRLSLLIPGLCWPLLNMAAAGAAQPACPVPPLFEARIPAGFTVPDRDLQDAELEALRFDLARRGLSVAEGEAELRRGDQRLRAERLEHDHATNTARASGALRYEDGRILLRATSGQLEIDTGLAWLREVDYQLREGPGSGRAALAERQGSAATRLQDVGYSTCPRPDPDWELRAATLQLDHESGFGEARDVRLLIGRRQLAWLPWLRFPIDERRRSGLLYPSFGISSRTGFDVTLPYYLNLAPHYDATLKPRLLTQRGLMLGGEFRYLGRHSAGQLEASWLPDDRQARRDRGAFSWQHGGALGQHWRTEIDVNRVSDRRYFEDFGDSLAQVATSLLGSRAVLLGQGPGWALEISGDAFQVVDPELSPEAAPYRRLPRVLLSAGPQRRSGLDYGLRAEAVHFDRDLGLTGQRLDLQPYLAFSGQRSWGFLRPELAWRETRYRLDASATNRRPSRGLPIASLDAGLFFDRERAAGRGRQSLEPRLYYLYVPFREQSELPVFDTAETSFGLAQLFRSNRFTGADRQQDANQLALAVTTRLHDRAGQERLYATLGQIRYFRDQQVQLPGLTPTQRSASAYVGELGWQPTAGWMLSSSLQWDDENARRDLASLRVQRSFGERGVANFAYRYRRGFIEQLDASVALPIGERWLAIGRWNHSLQDRRRLEALAGIEYTSCCYALRLLGRDYLRTAAGQRSRAVFLEIELIGLGAFGRRTEAFLQRSIAGYR